MIERFRSASKTIFALKSAPNLRLLFFVIYGNLK